MKAAIFKNHIHSNHFAFAERPLLNCPLEALFDGRDVFPGNPPLCDLIIEVEDFFGVLIQWPKSTDDVGVLSGTASELASSLPTLRGHACYPVPASPAPAEAMSRVVRWGLRSVLGLTP